jgi:hypothetical protein
VGRVVRRSLLGVLAVAVAATLALLALRGSDPALATDVAPVAGGPGANAPDWSKLSGSSVGDVVVFSEPFWFAVAAFRPDVAVIQG